MQTMQTMSTTAPLTQRVFRLRHSLRGASTAPLDYGTPRAVHLRRPAVPPCARAPLPGCSPSTQTHPRAHTSFGFAVACASASTPKAQTCKVRKFEISTVPRSLSHRVRNACCTPSHLRHHACRAQTCDTALAVRGAAYEHHTIKTRSYHPINFKSLFGGI